MEDLDPWHRLLAAVVRQARMDACRCAEARLWLAEVLPVIAAELGRMKDEG